MIRSEQRDDITPWCPHCSESLHTIQYRSLSGLLGRRYVYFCAVCRKVLGISHRPGFWLG